jgi:hypothetical protein
MDFIYKAVGDAQRVSHRRLQRSRPLSCSFTVTLRGIAKSLTMVACGVLVLGCASKHWEDVTGQGRGQSGFTMDRGRCQLVSQDASYREQLSVNQENANGCAGTAAGCGTLGVLQGVNIGLAGDNAFSACMNARGWILVADPVPAKKAPTQVQSEPAGTSPVRARSVNSFQTTIPASPSPAANTSPSTDATPDAGTAVTTSRIYSGPKVTEEEAKSKCEDKGLRKDTYVYGECVKAYLGH